jgi:hypothetical protein
MIVRWPEMPARPAEGEPLLMRVPTNGNRVLGRVATRAVLRQVVGAWSGDASDGAALRETARGPVWDGNHAGSPVAISVSYTDADAWIGVLRGGAIGVDAMCCAPLPDLEDVARLYLGPAISERVRRSVDPARAFALEWTFLEARLKCARRPLTEWPANQEHHDRETLAVRRYCDERTVVTVCCDTW